MQGVSAVRNVKGVRSKGIVTEFIDRVYVFTDYEEPLSRSVM